MPGLRHITFLAAVVALSAWLAGCADPYEGMGALEAERSALEREVSGLRESAARLDRGEPIFPPSHVLVALDESVVQRLVSANLPIDISAGPYHVTLSEVDVGFSGAPTVNLRGTVRREGAVMLEAAVHLMGALSDIEIHRDSSTLRATIAADHLGIERAAGIEGILSGASMADVGRLLRDAVAQQLPSIEIPVRVQEDIVIPAITQGPVRLVPGSLPVKATVSRVVAAEQRLWISLQVEVGPLGKVTP